MSDARNRASGHLTPPPEEGTPVTQERTHHRGAETSPDEPTQRLPLDRITAIHNAATPAGDPAGKPVEEHMASAALDDRPGPAVSVSPSVPVSVWTTAQSSPAAQRKGTYTAESTAHPAKMLPEVVRHAVAHCTRPGDLVLDPMCGIGTSLVEAVRLGRRAVGVEYEPHWVDVSNANLRLARDHHRRTYADATTDATTGANADDNTDTEPGLGVDVDGRVFHGDARQLATVLPHTYVGQATLVVTSPPYGPSTHGQVAVAPGEGVQKYHHLYGNTLDRGNLANVGHHRLLAGFTRILTGLRMFLRPGGHVVITIRPWREHAELIDLPAQILSCGRSAGLIPVERNVALLARVAETDLVARGSFFQRDFIRKQRDAGLPLHLIAHEDLLVFRTALSRSSSEKLKQVQAEPEHAPVSFSGSDAWVRKGSEGVAA